MSSSSSTSSSSSSWPVEVKSSQLPTNAGRGVFVTCDIEKVHTLLCFYDGYAPLETRDTTRQEHEYECDFDSGSVIGYIVARQPGGVAQLINDYMMPKLPVLTSNMNDAEQQRTIIKCFQDYVNESWRCNVTTDNKINPRGFVSTTPSLRKGQELYFHYGVIYWSAYLLKSCTSDRQMTRALVMFRMGFKFVLLLHSDAQAFASVSKASERMFRKICLESHLLQFMSILPAMWMRSIVPLVDEHDIYSLASKGHELVAIPDEPMPMSGTILKNVFKVYMKCVATKMAEETKTSAKE
jgi:hypothetical protein